MNTEEFIIRLSQLQKPARRLILESGDDGQFPITKIGGVPWWPHEVVRPTCARGHAMEFMAQIRLVDVPGFSKSEKGLFSFHYCTECSYEGGMSFGFSDAKNRGYDVRVFDSPDALDADGYGALTKATLVANKVTFSDYQEVPSPNEMPDELSRAIPDDYFQGGDYEENVYRSLIHRPLAKLGGWPSWPQNPEWPGVDHARMDFVCQLDAVLGERTVWASGCAMLFVMRPSSTPRIGELCIQTT